MLSKYPSTRPTGAGRDHGVTWRDGGLPEIEAADKETGMARDLLAQIAATKPELVALLVIANVDFGPHHPGVHVPDRRHCGTLRRAGHGPADHHQPLDTAPGRPCGDGPASVSFVDQGVTVRVSPALVDGLVYSSPEYAATTV